MGTFIENGASVLPPVKSNANAPTGAATEFAAGDSNQVREALLDLRTAILAIPPPTVVPTHNNLSGLQGGSLTERYHLTAAQVAAIGAEAGLPGIYNVKDYEAVGDGLTDDTAAINAAAAAAGKNILYFPPGNYLITGTITGGDADRYGTWMGAGTPGQEGRAATNKYVTQITCSGTNSGNYFVDPPNSMHGIYFAGDSRSNLGVKLGVEYQFRYGLRWSDIVIRNFNYGLRMYNLYDCSFDRLVIQDCNYGLYSVPLHDAGQNGGDNGYWTSVMFNNCWFSNCYSCNYTMIMDGEQAPTYGIVWNNMVIQKPYAGAAAAANLGHCNIIANGLYFESGGNDSIPALLLDNVSLEIHGMQLLFTYGIDLQNQPSTLILSNLLASGSGDIFRNVPSGACLDATDCWFIDDPRTVFTNIRWFQCRPSNTANNVRAVLKGLPGSASGSGTLFVSGGVINVVA